MPKEKRMSESVLEQLAEEIPVELERVALAYATALYKDRRAEKKGRPRNRIAARVARVRYELDRAIEDAIDNPF
jgi:hypothetical protein